MKTMPGWKLFLSFLIALLTCSPPAAWGAVAGDPDPDALDRWQLRTNLFLKGITYGQGKFVGVAYGGIFNSPDGNQWTQVAAGGSHFDIIYHADTFIAVGDLVSVWRSTNGTSWVSTSGISRSYGITYGQEKFVAVGDGGGVMLSETLGLTWTNIIPATNTSLWSVAYGSGQFVAVGSVGTTLRSTNGYDWVRGNMGTNASFYDLVYAQGLCSVPPRQ